ncbi:hypothetical protein Tco_1345307, partial [Tanacetum coccineum]
MKNDIGYGASDFQRRSSSNKAAESRIHGRNDGVSLLLQGHAIVPMQLVARVTADLFYWPLIQLAVATTHNIVLGVSVGSKGGGNLPGTTSNITLLLLMIGKCTADPNAFTEVGREDFFRNLHLQNHRALFISSSRPEPESFESSNEVNQHGEALVIEIPHTKDVSSGSDCFESVNSQLLVYIKCGATDRLADELLPNKTLTKELRPNITVQAVVIKIIQPKSKISYDELTTKLCPVLSIHKLYKLRTFYSHNSDDTNSVSPDVISKFKVLMSEDSNDPDSDSYLLDDNS